MENWKEENWKDWRGDLLKIGEIPDGSEETVFVEFHLDTLNDFINKVVEEAREEGMKEGMRLKKMLNYEECIMVEPRYISDWSDKYNKHYKCKRCNSKCLIPVIEPLVVICPKCGELDLDEVS